MSRFTLKLLVWVAILLCALGLLVSLPLFILGLAVGGLAVVVELAIEDFRKYLERRRRERMIKKYGSVFGARDQ
jgi:membrane protein implicated in regulation of membrane protease activity